MPMPADGLTTCTVMCTNHCAQGLVDPEVPPGSVAFVFAIFDNRSKLQYIGFSKDLRSSLRTLLTRRPDKAYTYK